MPRAGFGEHQKGEALAMLKDMLQNELSGLTLGDISKKTGVPRNNLTRWRSDIQKGKKPKRSRGKAAAPKDLETQYHLLRLRNKYLTKGLALPKEARGALEAEHLREVLQTVYHCAVEPLFAEPLPPKRGRPRAE